MIKEITKTKTNQSSKYIANKESFFFNLNPSLNLQTVNENIAYFETYAEALRQGYIPNEDCYPSNHSQGQLSEMILKAIALVKKQPKEKISQELLNELDIKPYHLNLWFKKHCKISFTTFQRLYRINMAFKELKLQQSPMNKEGFAYTIKKESQRRKCAKLKEHNCLFINRLNTAIGAMLVCSSHKGICLLEFTDRKMLETELADLQVLLSAKIIYGENEHIRQVKREISEYFQSQRETFSVALDTPGTIFQQEVWQSLIKIPYGLTRSYEQQAISLNKPKAVRAVANANGFNRVAIIIPCHRIIGKDGKLTGYGGGLHRKQSLILHEQKHIKTFDF